MQNAWKIEQVSVPVIIENNILYAVYPILTTWLSYQAYPVEEFKNKRNYKRITYLQIELKRLGVTA